MLNLEQEAAVENCNKFVKRQLDNFLLIGPAGSGKTTVIANALAGSNYNIAFCAFTNKATQILSNTSQKHGKQFNSDYMTIHKLLGLDIVFYKDDENDFGFVFDVKKAASSIVKYDIIIFDECSVISKELLKYITEAIIFVSDIYGKYVKCIYLGDSWQLPPVYESKSLVFERAVNDRWPVSKLIRVMRCNTPELTELNDILQQWIEKFKQGDYDDFVREYPYNIIPRYKGRYLGLPSLLNQYITSWRKISDSVILTYSNAHCDKINHSIQDILDRDAGRQLPEDRNKNIYFYVGDRCTIVRPVALLNVEELPHDDKTLDMRAMCLTSPTGDTLYNGDIFDIVETEDVYISTHLNYYLPQKKYFVGQRLVLVNINHKSTKYEILHCREPEMHKLKAEIKAHIRSAQYVELMTNYNRIMPALAYGYCITVYKSQGSEWNTVLVMLPSIRGSVLKDADDDEQVLNLFKATYTAVTRASHKLYCNWFS